MSDIALMMTGVLKTTQISPSNLPQQPPLELGYGIEKSTWSQLSQFNLTAQITPPEFIQPEKILATTSSALAPRKVNAYEKITKKTKYESPYSLAESKIQNKDAESSRRQKPKVTTELADGLLPTSNQSRDAKFSVKPTSLLPTLHFNDSGVPVRVLQRLLLSNGYRIQVDGVFGALTEIAVNAFQNRRNLVVDGIVGERTWYELAK